jgi:hypothetical protein
MSQPIRTIAAMTDLPYVVTRTPAMCTAAAVRAGVSILAALRHCHCVEAADIALFNEPAPLRTPSMDAMVRAVFAAFGDPAGRSAAAAALRALGRELRTTDPMMVRREEPVWRSVMLEGARLTCR